MVPEISSSFGQREWRPIKFATTHCNSFKPVRNLSQAVWHVTHASPQGYVSDEKSFFSSTKQWHWFTAVSRQTTVDGVTDLWRSREDWNTGNSESILQKYFTGSADSHLQNWSRSPSWFVDPLLRWLLSAHATPIKSTLSKFAWNLDHIITPQRHFLTRSAWLFACQSVACNKQVSSISAAPTQTIACVCALRMNVEFSQDVGQWMCARGPNRDDHVSGHLSRRWTKMNGRANPRNEWAEENPTSFRSLTSHHSCEWGVPGEYLWRFTIKTFHGKASETVKQLVNESCSTRNWPRPLQYSSGRCLDRQTLHFECVTKYWWWPPWSFCSGEVNTVKLGKVGRRNQDAHKNKRQGQWYFLSLHLDRSRPHDTPLRECKVGMWGTPCERNVQNTIRQIACWLFSLRWAHFLQITLAANAT